MRRKRMRRREKELRSQKRMKTKMKKKEERRKMGGAPVDSRMLLGLQRCADGKSSNF